MLYRQLLQRQKDKAADKRERMAKAAPAIDRRAFSNVKAGHTSQGVKAVRAWLASVASMTAMLDQQE